MTSNRRPILPRRREARRIEKASLTGKARGGAFPLLLGGDDLARSATSEPLFRDPDPRVYLMTLGRRRRFLGIPFWSRQIRIALTRERATEIGDAWIQSATLPTEIVS